MSSDYRAYPKSQTGTGKSVLLREIIRLRGDSLSGRVAITASTGIAALNIGGVTLHSWAGIKLGKEPVEQFVGKVRKQAMFEPLRERWREVTTLIVDESESCSVHQNDFLTPETSSFNDRWDSFRLFGRSSPLCSGSLSI